MISRTFDVERINYLVNHPSIRPFIGGDPEDELDLEFAVRDRQNHFLNGDHGGFSWVWTAPETYEVHTFILPEGRGKWAYRAASEAVEYMRNIGASHLWTRVHPDAENVRRFTLAAGLKPAGKHVIDLGVGPVDYDLFEWRDKCL